MAFYSCFTISCQTRLITTNNLETPQERYHVKESKHLGTVTRRIMGISSPRTMQLIRPHLTSGLYIDAIYIYPLSFSFSSTQPEIFIFSEAVKQHYLLDRIGGYTMTQPLQLDRITQVLECTVTTVSMKYGSVEPTRGSRAAFKNGQLQKIYISYGRT